MSTHAEYQQLLSRDLDGELAEVERQHLTEHLAGCGECQALRGQWRALRGAFQRDAVRQSSVGLKERIQARIARESEARAPAGPSAPATRSAVIVALRRSAVAAAVVLLLLGGLHVARLPDEVRAEDPPVHDPGVADFESDPEFREIMKERDPDDEPVGRYLESFVPDGR